VKNKWWCVAFAIVLSSIPLAAVAMPTAWEFRGALTSVTGDFPADFVAGTPYRIVVGFDTGAPVLSSSPSGGGTRYFYAADSLTYRVYIGTSCAPCEPTNNPAYDPAASSIIVRDGATDPAFGDAVDGYTFNLVTADNLTINLLLRGPVLDIVNGIGLPALPDPRLAGLRVASLDICGTVANGCASASLTGSVESVSTPSYGAEYTLTARDCYYNDTTTASGDPLPRDCVYVDAGGTTRSGHGRKLVIGGGLGSGEFTQNISFASDWTNYPGTGTSLGGAFGAVSFGGPAGLPVLKASSSPTDIARNNSNLLAYQRYTYSGAATSLPLIVDLGYGIADHSTDTSASAELGLRPGGATVGAVLTIVDGGIPMPALSGNINSLTCGAEASLTLPDGSPWPAGSILGSASFASPAAQVAAAIATSLDVRSCADPSQPVHLAANQSFIVVTSIQAPSRGKWSAGTQAAGNGYVDASHTMRVTFDPNAPSAVVQQLADSIAPQCADCFVPELKTVAIDVRPGSPSSDCIKPNDRGAIAVTIFGSADFHVSDVRLDDSLQLGTLGLRAGHKGPKCSVMRTLSGAFDDLACQFENATANWTTGQVTEVLTGKLYNGLPFQGSDTVCVK